MQDILQQLLNRRPLTEVQAEHALTQVLTGQANEAQVGAMLALLQAKGVTLDELVGGARVMRRYVSPVPVDPALRGSLLDTCGTGGAPKTFNISTGSAIVTAACEVGGRRVRVAKHGGRSRTGRGSAEVLEMLGVKIDASPEVQARCLAEIGVCFSFAIHHHPAMRFAAGPRKSLGFPTIFNLLGPLTNPAGAPRQVMGVYDRAFVEPIAEALLRLGAERAMVVHGHDGMDEITTMDRTIVAEVRDGRVTVGEFDAASVGIERCGLESLRVSSLEDAAAVIRGVLRPGGDPGLPARGIVIVNAAAALYVGDVVASIESGVEVAREAIESGRAEDTLRRLGELSHAE